MTEAVAKPRMTRRDIGITFAALLSCVITGWYTLLLQNSMADLQGVWGLSSDEGAILQLVATAPQMLMAPIVPWLAIVFGFRRVILPAGIAMTVLSFAVPFVSGYAPLLLIHGLLGVLHGIFITLTLMLIFRNVPPSLWLIPIGFFAFRVAFSVNSNVSISGLHIEHLGWQWIYWQTALLMVIYMVVMAVYLPPSERPPSNLMEHMDIPGMLFFCLGGLLLFIGTSQGERLGWMDSGLIVCCLFGGAALLALYVFNEKMVSNPWAPPSLLTADRNTAIALSMVIFYSFVTMANGMLMMRFLQQMQGLKSIQSGDVLWAVVISQALLIPLVLYLIKRIDARLVAAFGFMMLALGCWMGTGITEDWMAWDFLPMAIVFGIGHGFTMTGIVGLTMSVFIIQIPNIPRLLAFMQFGRLLGPILGSAVLTSYLRQRSDTYTVYLSEPVVGAEATLRKSLEMLPGDGLSSLSSLIRGQASLYAFQDCFALCFWVAVVSIVLIGLMKPPNPSPLFPVVIRKVTAG